MNPYESELLAIAQSDHRVIVMTAENRAHIRSLPSKLGDRFIDVGIAEQTLVGMACGLALKGRIPVVHALAPFITMRAFEFARTDAGIPGLPIKLVGFIPGLLSDGNGPTHQAIEDIALMRSIPGMRVFCPADMQEQRDELRRVVESASPYYIRYVHRETHAPLPEPARRLPGSAKVYFEGNKLLLLTTGILLHETIQTLDLLAAAGIHPTIAHLPDLPANPETLASLLASHSVVITIEDHLNRGGLHTEIASFACQNGLARPIHALGLDRWFRPGRLPDVIDQTGYSPKKLAARIQSHYVRLP